MGTKHVMSCAHPPESYEASLQLTLIPHIQSVHNLFYEVLTTTVLNKPEMVDVAALHMWNQKYGPHVIFDCNTDNTVRRHIQLEELLNTHSVYLLRSSSPSPHQPGRTADPSSLAPCPLPPPPPRRCCTPPWSPRWRSG